MIAINSRPGRIARWVIVNGLFAALLYWGFVQGVQGASNLARFMIWASFILAFFKFTPPRQATLVDRYTVIPARLRVPYNIIITWALAWLGLFGLAAVYFLDVTVRAAAATMAAKASEQDGAAIGNDASVADGIGWIEAMADCGYAVEIDRGALDRYRVCVIEGEYTTVSQAESSTLTGAIAAARASMASKALQNRGE